MKTKGIRRFGLLLLACSLSGCSVFGGGSDQAGRKSAERILNDKNSGTLNIVVASPTTGSFMQEYGSVLLAKFPQIEFQVKSLPPEVAGPPGTGTQAMLDKAGEFFRQDKPDLIFTSQLDDSWIKKGLLLDLETMVEQDHFDLENLHPGAVEPLRAAGGGKLYGLSPSLNATALIYNKDLFDRYHVAYPTDGMTWEQVIGLARKFPTDDGTGKGYGFAYNGPDASGLVRSIAAQGGLIETDPTGTRSAINSPAWKAIWHLVLDNASAISFKPSATAGPGSTLSETLKRDPFLTGSAAMSLGTSTTIASLANPGTNGMQPFHWDLVTEPTDPRYPGETTSYSVGDIFAIGANGSNQKMAWEVIKYVTGEPFAAIYQKVASYHFPARTSALDPVDGHSLDAFFKLKPNKLDLAAMRKNIPSGFYPDYLTLVRPALQEIQNGKPVDSVLDGLQKELQQKLDERNAAERPSG